jgi:hypothetical protein
LYKIDLTSEEKRLVEMVDCQVQRWRLNMVSCCNAMLHCPGQTLAGLYTQFT